MKQTKLEKEIEEIIIGHNLSTCEVCDGFGVIGENTTGGRQTCPACLGKGKESKELDATVNELYTLLTPQVEMGEETGVDNLFGGVNPVSELEDILKETFPKGDKG